MLHRPRALVLLLLAAFAVSGAAQAQSNRLLPLDDVAYRYIERLQRRGRLLELHPTALPYRYGEVAAALRGIDRSALSPVEAAWVAQLDARFPERPDAPGEAVLGVRLGGGGSAANTRRLDALRPLGTDAHGYEHAFAQVFLEKGPLVAQLGARHDLYYDRDPDGLDAVRRLVARSEESYAGVHTPFASLYLGRFANHWGLPGGAGVVLSDNPRSYDQLNLRLGGPRLSVRSLLGELDSITADGRYTGIAGDDSVRASERRFFAAHRFDWRPTPNLVLSLMESALYSGGNSGLSLKYLNPVNPFFFVVDNRPKNDENNGAVAGLIWLHAGRFTLHGQLMFDDFDVLNGQEPASFALTGSLVYAARANVDLGGGLDVVAARTYNTIQPEGRFIYLLRGLATQFSDYVHAHAFADLYLVPGLILTPRLDVLAQGERDIRQPFPEKDSGVPAILTGVVERTVRTSVRLFFQRDPRWWVRLDLGVNVTTNKESVEGVDETRFVGLAEFGVRLTFDRNFKLRF
ncbi:hypothetical protein [Rhodocaloribacter sp.]